jgi:hypothetical protein
MGARGCFTISHLHLFDHGSKPLSAMSVVLGNIIAADHGMWQCREGLRHAPGGGRCASSGDELSM